MWHNQTEREENIVLYHSLAGKILRRSTGRVYKLQHLETRSFWGRTRLANWCTYSAHLGMATMSEAWCNIHPVNVCPADYKVFIFHWVSCIVLQLMLKLLQWLMSLPDQDATRLLVEGVRTGWTARDVLEKRRRRARVFNAMQCNGGLTIGSSSSLNFTWGQTEDSTIIHDPQLSYWFIVFSDFNKPPSRARC